MRLLFLCLLFYIGYKVVKAFVAPSKPSRPTRMKEYDQNATQIDDVMVKDPVCETYIPKREGIQSLVHGEAVYFCSAACRDKYLDKIGNKPE